MAHRTGLKADGSGSIKILFQNNAAMLCCAINNLSQYTSRFKIGGATSM